MSEAWVVLAPLDAVEFRDGRPFSAGANAWARTTFPRPTSTAGAVKAAFGREPDRVEGPLLVDLQSDSFLFPCPADLVFHDGEPVRLAPPGEQRPGVSTDLDSAFGAPPGFTAPVGPGTRRDLLLDGRRLERYLHGDPAAIESIRRFQPEPRSHVLLSEHRTGLARDGRTVRPGMLYTAEFLRFAPERDLHVGFACRVTFDAGEVPPTAGMVRLGGEARQAEVTVLAEGGPGGPMLPAPPADIGRRVLVYLATPAVFANGWLPDDLGGGVVRSACVEGPEVAASWLSGAAGPQPAQWAVAAGSVYFVEFDDERAASTFVAARHGRCLPQANDRLRTAGFGMCLTGRW